MFLLFDELLNLTGAIRQFQYCGIGALREIINIQRITGWQQGVDGINQNTIDGIYFQAFDRNQVVTSGQI